MRDDNLVRQGSKVDELVVDPITSTIYHIERRPAEAGRNVIVHTEKGEDAVGKEWNVRSGVHEVSTIPLPSGRNGKAHSDGASSMAALLQPRTMALSISPISTMAVCIA